jgi:RNA polymerase sigma-70 factor (ECF subfamily)
MAALALLTNEDRALLGLRFGADLAMADVAAALDIPLGTAKSRLHRALGRLAAAMGEDDDR